MSRLCAITALSWPWTPREREKERKSKRARTRARARALPPRRASSYKHAYRHARTHVHERAHLLSFSHATRRNGCTRSLLLRAEWALVDEILTSENRNPLRDLPEGFTPLSSSLLTPPSVVRLLPSDANDAGTLGVRARR